LFLIASLVVVLTITLGIKGFGRLFQPSQTRVATFSLRDDLGGLRVGDDVRIGGVKVGVVRDISLSTPAPGPATGPAIAPTASPQPRIRVTFSMPRAYVLRRGAALRVQGTITGQSWLNFDDLGEGEALASGSELVGHPSAMGQFMAALAAAAPEIQGIVTDLHRQTVPAVNDTMAKFGRTADAFRDGGQQATQLVEQVRAYLPGVVARYHELGLRWAEVAVAVRDLFGDTAPNIRQALADVRAIGDKLRQKLPGMLDRTDLAIQRMTRAIDGVNSSMADLKASMENVRNVTATARSVITGNRGKLDRMITSLKDTSENLKDASAEIRHSPWRLLYKPTAAEAGNLNLYDAARQFADGAGALDDAVTSLRDALSDPNADRAQIERLMQRVDQAFGHFSQVEKKLWDDVKQ
jgi:hypothetical protein